ncbi:MAG: hypothetical protein LC105_02815 [Chitinophagales bacterium]|nr:hypothetical protein [Chitinophagales bacterium]MCZ2392772.1 hypothetical protein [Chitinophagales bacterium]
MKYINTFIFIGIVGIITACKKDTDKTVIDLKTDYFVDDVGSFIVYQVDSVLYNDFTGEVTSKSTVVKEKVVEEFKDDMNRLAKRWEKYTFDSTDKVWKAFRSYYTVRQNQSIERVEENLRFISIVFPPKKDLTWKGNRFINAVDNNKYLSDWTYLFTTVDVPTTVLKNNFDLTATILLRDKETAIERVFAKEIYARGVGLIYKEWWHLETQNISDLPWVDKAENGYIVKWQALDYGKE